MKQHTLILIPSGRNSHPSQTLSLGDVLKVMNHLDVFQVSLKQAWCEGGLLQSHWACSTLTLVNRKELHLLHSVRKEGPHKSFRISPKYSVMAEDPTIHLREGMESFVSGNNSMWLLKSDKNFEHLLL
ncbi:UNVERIFIED_CONTAM: hypothetical protein K2H54_051251 [Gekko kuhli]